MARPTIVLKLDDREALRVLGDLASRLEPGRFEAIVARAQNDALGTGRAEAVRVIRDEYAAPAGEIRKTMTVKKANRRTLVASLTMRGRMSIELMQYQARESKKGVSVQVRAGKGGRSVIKAGGDMKILETKKLHRPRTWIAKNHVLAMTEHDERPIRMLWGPSFLSRLSSDDARARIEGAAADRFRNRLTYYAEQELLKDKA